MSKTMNENNFVGIGTAERRRKLPRTRTRRQKISQADLNRRRAMEDDKYRESLRLRCIIDPTRPECDIFDLEHVDASPD